MARPYAKLRGALREHGMPHSFLARRLTMSEGWLSKKMNGKVSWSLDEAYATLALLGRPASDLVEFFPPGGQNEASSSRGAAAGAGRRTARVYKIGAARRI